MLDPPPRVGARSSVLLVLGGSEKYCISEPGGLNSELLFPSQSLVARVTRGVPESGSFSVQF